MSEPLLFPAGPAGADAGHGPAADAPEARSLPANLEAEAALIGAVLIDNRILETMPVPLAGRHFYEPVHARLFDRIVSLVDGSAVVTPVTLRPYFEVDDGLKAMGGLAYLARLTGSDAGLVSSRDLARQIYDLALLRELVAVGRTLVEAAMDTAEGVDPKAQIEAAEKALYTVAEGQGGSGESKPFGEASRDAIRQIEKALNSGGHISGVTTGLTSMNEKIGGLHDSDLVILAGRPGMGKTSLATNIAYNAAARWLEEEAGAVPVDQRVGAPVVFFSLEMSADQLATRVLAEQSGISSEALRMGRISKDDFQRLSTASQMLSRLPLFIDDTAALSIAALRARARRLKRQHDIGLVVVDYLQLLQGSARANDNRVNEISEISRGLKTLAKELDVPVIALSQLSRAVENREDKRPQLSDLRESGSIEQDADIVLFIFREEYYLAAREPQFVGHDARNDEERKLEDAHSSWATQMRQVEGIAEVIVAKQRHGATGKVRLRFESRITRFSDLAPDAMEGFGD